MAQLSLLVPRLRSYGSRHQTPNSHCWNFGSLRVGGVWQNSSSYTAPRCCGGCWLALAFGSKRVAAAGLCLRLLLRSSLTAPASSFAMSSRGTPAIPKRWGSAEAIIGWHRLGVQFQLERESIQAQ